MGEMRTQPINLTRQNIITQHLIQQDLNDVPASRRVDKMRQVSEIIKKLS